MVPNGTDPENAERISAQWLALRETLDTEARQHVQAEVAQLINTGFDTVIDLGCGSGAASLWLQPLLPAQQRWVLIDHDPDLLALTTQRLREAGAAGDIITVNEDLAVLSEVLEAEKGNRVFLLASALLDLMRPQDIDTLITAIARHRTTGLISMSVDGQISWDPPNPQDIVLRDAFNRHQRRGSRLGPDAVAYFIQAAQQAGIQLDERDTPWQLQDQYPQAQKRFFSERVQAAADQLRQENRHDDADTLLHQWLPYRLELIDQRSLLSTVGHQDILLGLPSHPDQA